MGAEPSPSAPLLPFAPLAWACPRTGLPPARTAEDALCGRLFWGWLIVRTLLWSLLATLTQPNAPLDAIEWLYWGHEWCWGYHKHPPLPAWMIECCARLTPGSLAAVYLASYLCVGASMWAVWRLGREFLSPRLALLAALSLEGVTFYTLAAAEFNNNVVLNAASALAVVGFYFALRTGRPGWWLGTGLVLGMALLAKYTAAFLIVPMFLFLLVQPQARRVWRQPGPYLAAAAALLVFAPHVLWMVQHDFLTLQYARSRSAGTGSWFDHVRYPLDFLLSQLVRLLPLLLVLLPLVRWRRPAHPLTSDAGDTFKRDFLLMMVLGPVALHLLVSGTAGLNLRAIWGAQLWTFTGLLLLFLLRARLPSRVNRWAWARLVAVAALMLVLTTGKNLVGPFLTQTPSRVHFPGRELARAVSDRWQQCDQTPFPLVAGDWWLAGNVACYAPHRPSVYPGRELELYAPEPRAASWTSDEDLRRRGGVLLWNAGRYGNELPADLRDRFPEAQVQSPLLLPYRHWARIDPVHVGLAFLSPGGGGRAASAK